MIYVHPVLFHDKPSFYTPSSPGKGWGAALSFYWMLPAATPVSLTLLSQHQMKQNADRKDPGVSPAWAVCKCGTGPGENPL